MNVVWNVGSVLFGVMVCSMLVNVVSSVLVIVMLRFIDSICMSENRLLLLFVLLVLRFFSVSVFIVVNCIELNLLNSVRCMIFIYIGIVLCISVKFVIIMLIMIVFVSSILW